MKTNMDLKARFTEFNRIYFADSLPSTTKVVFTQSKRVGGYAKYFRNKFGIVYTKPIKIAVDNKFSRTDSEIDGILLHEMIHLFLGVVNVVEKDPHGPEFESLRVALEKSTGIAIPVESENNWELRNPKPVYVTLVRGNGRIFFSFITKKLHDEIYLKNPKGVRQISDAAFVQLAAQRRVSRKIESMKVYLCPTELEHCFPLDE